MCGSSPTSIAPSFWIRITWMSGWPSPRAPRERFTGRSCSLGRTNPNRFLERKCKMTRNWIAAIVVLATMISVGRAQKNEPVAPKSAPPTFAFVHELDKSQNLIYVRIVNFVPCSETRTVQETVEKDGKKSTVAKQMTVKSYISLPLYEKVAAEKVNAINGAGKKLSRDDLFQQLKAGDSILLYSGELDPVFLKPLKEKTILLQMETSPPIVPPMTVPEPIPPPKK